MSNFVELGKKIYRLNNPREAHRFAVFVARCCLHPGRIAELENFFHGSEILSEMAENYPFFYEQVTRAFFYHRSTFDERMKLVKENAEFFSETMSRDFLRMLYGEKTIDLWKLPIDENLGDLNLILRAEPGQRKESLASVMLRLNERINVYQIMFWIARDDLTGFSDATGDFAMWIGAIQGPNVEDARELIKKITKKSQAYRTKNLILYAARAVARSLGVKKIFAVTNEGYYANNHIRRDRKLKVNFADLWRESGGTLTEDKRFFSLPLIEKRKTVEEMPSQKRALYRRRFAMLDELDAAVEEKISSFKRGAAK